MGIKMKKSLSIIGLLWGLFTMVWGQNFECPIAITYEGQIGGPIICTFAGHETAADGLDETDQPSPPPAFGLYVYFHINEFPNYLRKDTKNWLTPFHEHKVWKLVITNSTTTLTLSWEPQNLPEINGGKFILSGPDIPETFMKSTSSVAVSGNATLFIEYFWENGLSVELRNFTAVAGTNWIDLSWVTESETDNLGFEVWRTEYPDRPFAVINPFLIKGAGTSAEQHCYRFRDLEVKAGRRYYYKIADINSNGQRHFSQVVSAFLPLPQFYSLEQNHPNPFNTGTTFTFALPQTEQVTLEVFNINGQRIAVLIDEQLPAGYHKKQWNAIDEQGTPLSSGTYLYRFRAGRFHQVRKLTVIK